MGWKMVNVTFAYHKTGVSITRQMWHSTSMPQIYSSVFKNLWRFFRPVPTTPNIVGCCTLRPFAHPVACCRLGVVAQSLKPVKLFSQQLPTFLFFRDRRSVAQQCWIRLHSSSNIVGATHAHYAWFTKTYGFYPSHVHCRFQHCWELLHPFAHHCQHARINSQHCWRNNV